MSIKERIVAKASEMFFKYGIRSITMNDVAKELGISKKTIYQHFEDKDELVYQIMKAQMEKDQCEWFNINENTENEIEKIIMAMDLIRKSMVDLNSSIVFDIKKYYPRAWEVLESHKKDFVIPEVTKDLQNGIKQGLFREDLNIDLMARYRFGQALLGFDQSIFPNELFNVVEIQTTLLDNYLRGILTDKGYSIYNTIKHDNEKK